jgi:signal transduction histidine kinase
LINDILDIERIESGQIEMKCVVQELMPLVQRAVTDNQAYARQFNVNLRCNSVLRGARVSVESDRLLQVLTNLISNAVKYSPPGGEVLVTVERRGNRLHVLVTDRGPGIAEHFRERIFGRFQQADSTDARAKGGSGLGLSIAKAIVEQFGGIIGFDTVVGQGSTFWFHLAEHKAPTDPNRNPVTGRVGSGNGRGVGVTPRVE